MPFTTIAVAAPQDTHVFVPSQELDAENLSTSFPPLWTRSGDAGHGQMGGINVVDSNFPIFAAYDRRLVEDTRPMVSSTEFFLLFRATGSTVFAQVDTIMIKIDNAADITGGVAAIVETADNNDFTAALTVVNNFGTITQNRRQIALLATGYLSTTNWRVRLSLPGGAAIPQVSEFWLGRRFNITSRPKGPYDDGERRSDADMVRSKGGVYDIYARSTRGRTGVAVFEYQSNTLRDAFRSIYDESDGFTRPFILIDRPISDLSATTIVAVNTNPRISQPIESWADSARTIQIPFDEAAPYRVKE